MGHRIIQGLQWAKGPMGKPRTIPASRATGVRRKGLLYEKALGKSIPEAKPGLWWEFEDKFGHGWCQTDLVLKLFQDLLLVLESKLTWTPEAHQQLELLYKPVLELATGRKIIGVAVAKNLLRGMPKVVKVTDSLPEAVAIARTGAPVVLHWIGLTTIEASGL